ncbi:MAG: hypothetical protein F6K24_20420 [Okeania sp. SIO2D1]|nr:hypothetical protein [Okeania sp. SIO2D1]
MPEQYYLIKRKVDCLVLQVDQENIYSNSRCKKTPLWVVAAKQTGEDNQLWKITTEGHIISKFENLALEIDKEDILPVLIDLLNDLKFISLDSVAKQVIQGYIDSLAWLLQHQKLFGKSLGCEPPKPLFRATVADDIADNKDQKWVIEEDLIKSKIDGRVLELFGSGEYGPVTTNKLNRDPDQQEAQKWELIPVNNSLNQNNRCLEVNKFLTSANGIYTLFYEASGNLVLYKNFRKTNPGAVWSSKTFKKPAHKCLFHYDSGELILYGASDPNGDPKDVIWSSGIPTQKSPPFKLIVENDGRLVIYDKDMNISWDSKNP